MSRARSRPRRGDPDANVLVSGDTGIFGGPQSTGPGITESGDLEAREFGVPQADIPGGVKHLVNPQTVPERGVRKPKRPADYHREHGVEPQDWGDYADTPDATQEHRPHAAPEPKLVDAVPVYIVQRAERERVIRDVAAEEISVVASGSDPTRICGLDDQRTLILLLCTDASNDVRFSQDKAAVLEGRGALLSHSATSYTPVPTQGELWAAGSSSSARSNLSIIMITEVPEPSAQ